MLTRNDQPHGKHYNGRKHQFSTRHASQKWSGYFVLANALIRDKELSPAAKRLYAALLAYKGGKEYIENALINKYIADPHCTVILFENPPYAETTSVEHQKKALALSPAPGSTAISWGKCAKRSRALLPTTLEMPLFGQASGIIYASRQTVILYIPL